MSSLIFNMRSRLNLLIGTRVLPVLLAALLQLMPMLRAVISTQSQSFTPSNWAYVFKVAGGVVALLGSYHAVSGATAVVAPYTVNAQVGVPYSRQLTTSGQTAHSWSASTAANGSAVFPLTPGLWLTNSNGKIGGTPTVAIVSNITISAWENSGNKGASVSAVFVFTITNGGGQIIAPTILTQPQSQTNYVGAAANFTVTAAGTAPLSYQWRFNGAPISGATASNYALPNLQTSNAGTYSVVVTNTAGTATSSNAILTVLVPTADVAVLCNGPGTVAPGTALNYTVTVTNLGPLAASNVVVMDTLPLTAVFSSASGGGVANSGLVTWPAITALASGGVANYTVTVTAPANGSLTNSASATSSTADPNAANNNGTAANSQVITTVAPQADVATTCSGPASVAPGATFNCSVTVTNLGPSTASNVVVTDSLPGAATFVSATGGGANNSGIVTWPAMAALASGGTTNFTVTVTAPAGGSLTNIASSSSSVFDPVAANNNGSAAAAQVITAIGAQADLMVFKTGPPVVLAGSNLTYTINVTNAGPSTATNVLLKDFLPANVVLISASGGGALAGGVITWPITPSLPSGGAGSYTVTVKAPGTGTLTNSAAATSITPDPNPANNNGTSTNSQAVTIVATARGQFGISIYATITLNPQTGLYEQSVTVTNTGPVTAAAVKVYVLGLRSGVQLYNLTGTDENGPYVQYNAPLNPAQAVTFLLEFFVPDRGSFTDSFQAIAILPASSGPVSGGFAINRVFTDMRVPGSPRLVVEFTTVPGQVYTVIYSDDGMATWQVATPSITATATITQWYDDGPPETLSNPLSGGSRLYRVIAGPVAP